MTGKSTYLETALLNWEFRGVAFPTVPTVYLGLFTSDPTDAATGGVEVTTTLRTAGRLVVPTSSFATAPSGSPTGVTNTVALDFGNAAAGAGPVTYAATFDALTGGNKLRTFILTSGVTFTTGQDVQFAIGSLSATET